jgi:cell division protein FtsL
MEQTNNQQQNMKRIARLKRLERMLILAFILVCALLTYFLL